MLGKGKSSTLFNIKLPNSDKIPTYLVEKFLAHSNCNCGGHRATGGVQSCSFVFESDR